MAYVTCLQCEQEIRLPETADIGDLVLCRVCGARMEIVELHPIVLDWPWEGDEDLLDDEDDEYGDGFDVWSQDEDLDDEEDLDDDLDDDDLVDEDEGDINYSAFDQYDQDDFSYARIKHLDD